VVHLQDTDKDREPHKSRQKHLWRLFLWSLGELLRLRERQVLQGYLLSCSRSCCSNSSAGVRYLFVALHAVQHGTTLPLVLRPPRESGTI
jgi:hypothetical protein